MDKRTSHTIAIACGYNSKDLFVGGVFETRLLRTFKQVRNTEPGTFGDAENRLDPKSGISARQDIMDAIWLKCVRV